jgi:hypothetical protein
MAATDTFQSFNAGLGTKERETLNQLIKMTTDELLAARSEDARMRIVDVYLKIVQERIQA